MERCEVALMTNDNPAHRVTCLFDEARDEVFGIVAHASRCVREVAGVKKDARGVFRLEHGAYLCRRLGLEMRIVPR